MCVCVAVSGQKITELTVPPYVDVRDTATLVCHYKLENTTLNSVKWYKGEQEFFRYTPGMSPPTRTFPTAGISLDVSMRFSEPTHPHKVYVYSWE